MDTSKNHSSWKFAALARPIVAAAAVAALAGCTVHVHDHDDRERVVYTEAPPPQREVIVQQPPPAPEPVEQVVYEPAPPQVVTVYEPVLQPHGHWVVIGRYGRCWVWDHRPDHWRPYTVGHWVATDQGWLWVAEGEEVAWGETCYHYGRWYEDPAEGWVWVPGQVWAPSWCAWREGGGYSAWAPLPPECGDGHSFDHIVVDRYIPEDRYVCVHTRDVTSVHIHETIIEKNVTIIHQTTNITNITIVNGRAVNRGVDVKHVQAASGRKVNVTKVTQVTNVEEAHKLMAQHKPVMYNPVELQAYVKTHPVAKQVAEHREHPEARVNAEEHKEAVTEKRDEHKEAVTEKRDEHKEAMTAEEKARQDKLAAEKADKEKAQADKLAAEKADKEKMAEEKLAREKAAADERAAKEKSAADEKAAKEKMAQEKAAEEKAALQKQKDEKLAAEKAAQDAKEQKAKEAAEAKAAKEKAAQEKAAEEKAAREKNKGAGSNENGQNDPNNPKKKPKNPNETNQQ